ncbi:uncharacterized protein [Cherax quadricarinatus]
MRPRWQVKEYSLIKYLRECVWALERLDSRINMIRHSWSTPCFIPEEMEPSQDTLLRSQPAAPRPRSRSCLIPPELQNEDVQEDISQQRNFRRLSCIPSKDDDDDDAPIYIPGTSEGPVVGAADEKPSTSDPATESEERSTTASPTRCPTRSSTSSPTQCASSRSRAPSSSPSRDGSRSTSAPVLRPRVLYRTRKTSMPSRIRIPEDGVAYCLSPLFSPLSSPPIPSDAFTMKQLEYGSGGLGTPLSPTVRRSVDEASLWRRRTGAYAVPGAYRQTSTEEVRRRRESLASASPHHLSTSSIHHPSGKCCTLRCEHFMVSTVLHSVV